MWKNSDLSAYFERYWMPEFPPTSLNFAFNSKSSAVSSQTRKRLAPPGSLPSLVYPVMAPSLTDHRSGRPFHPVRSLPLNSDCQSSAVAASGRARSTRALRRGRRMGVLSVGDGGWRRGYDADGRAAMLALAREPG